MNTPDELIQKQVEEGNAPSGANAEVYRLVFHSLKKEPAYKLSTGFASRVASQAMAPAKSFDWEKLLLIGVPVAFLSALIYCLVVTDFTLSAGAFQFLAGYPTLFVFGTVFIIVLHLLDKKLVTPNNG